MSDSLFHRHGSALARFEAMDETVRAWALASGAEEYHYPVLIAAATLRRAEYPEAFPHLLMAPAVAADPGKIFADQNARLTPWFLSPAVCYHAYSGLAGQTLPEARLITARGCCFRNEEAAELAPGRRQIEFEMRELILVGPTPWLEERLLALQPEVEALATAAGLRGEWRTATDPFFLPRARGKAHLQRLLGTKLELCLPDGLAIASINRHGHFFGDRFEISTAGGARASSACIAFGLDRWVAHSRPENP